MQRIRLSSFAPAEEALACMAQTDTAASLQRSASLESPGFQAPGFAGAPLLEPEAEVEGAGSPRRLFVLPWLIGTHGNLNDRWT